MSKIITAEAHEITDPDSVFLLTGLRLPDPYRDLVTAAVLDGGGVHTILPNPHDLWLAFRVVVDTDDLKALGVLTTPENRRSYRLPGEGQVRWALNVQFRGGQLVSWDAEIGEDVTPDLAEQVTVVTYLRLDANGKTLRWGFGWQEVHAGAAPLPERWWESAGSTWQRDDKDGWHTGQLDRRTEALSAALQWAYVPRKAAEARAEQDRLGREAAAVAAAEAAWQPTADDLDVRRRIGWHIDNVSAAPAYAPDRSVEAWKREVDEWALRSRIAELLRQVDEHAPTARPAAQGAAPACWGVVGAARMLHAAWTGEVVDLARRETLHDSERREMRALATAVNILARALPREDA